MIGCLLSINFPKINLLHIYYVQSTVHWGRGGGYEVALDTVLKICCPLFHVRLLSLSGPPKRSSFLIGDYLGKEFQGDWNELNREEGTASPRNIFEAPPSWGPSEEPYRLYCISELFALHTVGCHSSS